MKILLLISVTKNFSNNELMCHKKLSGNEIQN